MKIAFVGGASQTFGYGVLDDEIVVAARVVCDWGFFGPASRLETPVPRSLGDQPCSRLEHRSCTVDLCARSCCW
jgi:hypothetical protein